MSAAESYDLLLPPRVVPLDTILHGDCLEVLRTLPDASVDAIVTDPPYGLGAAPDMVDVLRAWLAGEAYTPRGKGGFMGKTWDKGVPGPEYWRECLRVLKPGGHALVFAGTRTWDVMGLALRLAGFELRDTLASHGTAPALAWVYAQGFPKSSDPKKVGGKSGLSCHCQSPVVCYPCSQSKEVAPHGDMPDLRSTIAEDAAKSAPEVLFDSLHGQGEAHAAGREGVRGVWQAMATDDTFSGGTQQDLRASVQCEAHQPIEASAATQAIPHGDLLALWEGLSTSRQAHRGEVLQPVMPSQGARASSDTVQRQHEGPQAERPALWPAQSGMEGRRDAEADARQLSGRPVRAVSSRIPANGARRRLRDGASASDGSEGGTTPGTRRSGTSHRPQSSEQSPRQSGTLPEQCSAQTCGRCGKPIIPDGLGTALKPAWEPIIVCRKPLGEGTVAANVIRHGVGALNIGASRVATDDSLGRNNHIGPYSSDRTWSVSRTPGIETVGNPAGRWPPNLLLSHSLWDTPDACSPDCPVAALDAQSGRSSNGAHTRHSSVGKMCYHGNSQSFTGSGYGDSGGASRYFPVFQPDNNPPVVQYDCNSQATTGENEWASTGQSHSILADSDTPRRRAITATTSGTASVGEPSWPTSLSGSAITAPSPKASKSTTRTTTSKTTVSKTLNSLTPSPTSASIAAVNCDMVSGGSLVTSAESSSPLPPSIGTSAPQDTRSTDDADLATFARWSQTNSAAAPFKYQAKASRSERTHGGQVDNRHCTVKPLALMSWLITLITPPGGIVLDPFAGSGSTLVAAQAGGWHYIGVEREAEYVTIARARLEATSNVHNHHAPRLAAHQSASRAYRR